MMKRPRNCLTDEQPDDYDLLSTNHLKSTFQGIFNKYGKDFTDLGDEVDLRTGKIVVNNGHISRMRDEKDIFGVGPRPIALAEKVVRILAKVRA